MIQKFVDAWYKNLDHVSEVFRENHPGNYEKIIRILVQMLADELGKDGPDPNRITEIDYGDYQGTLVYVIGQKGPQPGTHWTTSVSYGSCSGCDTLEAIRSEANGPQPTEDQMKEYRTLALHLLQKMKEV